MSNENFAIGDGVFVGFVDGVPLRFGRIIGSKIVEVENENELGDKWKTKEIVYTIEFPKPFTLSYQTEERWCYISETEHESIERNEGGFLYRTFEEAKESIFRWTDLYVETAGKVASALDDEKWAKVAKAETKYKIHISEEETEKIRGILKNAKEEKEERK